MGKETLINATIERIRAQAKKDKLSPDFRRRLENIFGDETDAVIEEIKSGEITENVKLFAFNTLLDFQPVALSEMPQYYLDLPNGRTLYMLKTFTIKQFDIARREGIWRIKGIGGHPKDAKTKADGVRRLMYLSALFALTGAGADEIKNWILGRDETFSDKTWDAVLKLFGLSRFVKFNMDRYGLTDTLFKLASVPLEIIENPYKDAKAFINAYKKGEIEDFKIKDLSTWKSIPFFGKQYHFWFGRGKSAELFYGAEKRVKDKLEKSIRKELDEQGVKIGTFGREIFGKELSNEQYLKLQDTAADIMQANITNIINQKYYRFLSKKGKAELLKKEISKSKSTARGVMEKLIIVK